MEFRKIIFFLFFVAALFYGLFTARGVLFAPKLKILSPKNYTTLHSTKVKIEGIASPSTALWIGGRMAQSDESGFFEEILYVHPGYNEIGISVKNKFGRESKKVLKLAVE